MNIYVRSKPKQRWRISGFPDSAATISAEQQLQAPFGHFAHGRPGTAPCESCDERRLSGVYVGSVHLYNLQRDGPRGSAVETKVGDIRIGIYILEKN